MLVKRINLIITTFIIMLILSALIDNVVIAGGITFLIIIIGYIFIANKRSRKRLNLLKKYCDPYKFLNATEEQQKITGKNPKINAYLNIDKSVAFILMGNFQQAKEVLLSIDKSYLSNKSGTLLLYTINLISCLYELGELSDAEELFETQIPILAPVNKRMNLAVNLLIAERFFFLNRYKESKEKFEEILSNEKLDKCTRLSILYTLAQIDKQNGDLISARNKYKEILDNGNKLYIAVKSKEYLIQT